MTRYVIIGSGAAGISAIEAIRKTDTSSEIFLIRAEKEGYYSRPGLAYYLSKEISEKQLFPFSPNDFMQLKVSIIDGIAKKVKSSSKTILFVNGRELKYDKLLIAVGAEAVLSTIPGNQLNGVVYLDQIKSTKEILKKARKAKIAVVIGGGITALEIVEGLLANRVKVHFILRKNRYWGGVLNPEESKIIEERLINQGVKIHYNTEIEKILEKKEKVKGVLTKSGEEIIGQIVAFAIGVRPRIQIAKNSGIFSDKGILVNQLLETNLPDVYAAGDVTQVFDPRAGKAVVDSLWNLARKQGTTAGINMAGGQKSYIKEVPFNVTRLAGMTTSIIGAVGIDKNDQKEEIVRGESETWHHVPDAIICQNKFEGNRIRLMIGEKRILGALVMGDQSISYLLHELVNNEVDISSIRDKILGNKLDIVKILNGFWKKWRKVNA